MIMKKLLILGIVALLSACVVAPIPNGRVVIQPSVEFVYIWDPIRIQYYYVDRGHRHYQPHGWGNQRHPHGGPPGHNKHHKHHKD
jgi:hypothetical protein